MGNLLDETKSRQNYYHTFISPRFNKNSSGQERNMRSNAQANRANSNSLNTAFIKDNLNSSVVLKPSQPADVNFYGFDNPKRETSPKAEKFDVQSR